jgi:hypothetical protein
VITLIREEFLVDASLEAAWNHLARVEKWPTWARHIRRIELTPPGPLTPASEGRIYLSNGMRSTFRMAEFNPHRNWKWIGPFLWLTVHYDHQSQIVNEGRTRLIWIVAADGFAGPLLGPIFASIYQRNLSKAIPRLVSEFKQTGLPSSVSV